MTAQDLALILLQLPVDLEVEVCGEPITSVAQFGGRVNIDCEPLALDDAETVFFLAQGEGEEDDF